MISLRSSREQLLRREELGLLPDHGKKGAEVFGTCPSAALDNTQQIMEDKGKYEMSSRHSPSASGTLSKERGDYRQCKGPIFPLQMVSLVYKWEKHAWQRQDSGILTKHQQGWYNYVGIIYVKLEYVVTDRFDFFPCLSYFLFGSTVRQIN